MTARKHQYDAETAVLRQKIAQLEEQIAGTQAQIDGTGKQQSRCRGRSEGARKLLSRIHAENPRAGAATATPRNSQADRGAQVAEMAAASSRSAKPNSRSPSWSASASARSPTSSRDANQARRTRPARSRRRATCSAHPGHRAGERRRGRADGLHRGRRHPARRAAAGHRAAGQSAHRRRAAAIDRRQRGEARQAADVQATSMPRSERPTLNGEVITVSADKMTDDRSARAALAALDWTR